MGDTSARLSERLRYDHRIVNRLLRSFPALGAFFVAAVALAACGDSVPGNAVARVDDSSITRTEFDRWFAVAASSNPATAGGKANYDPPAYTKCVANKRKTAPKPAKGQPLTTDAQFKTQCQQEYEGLRDQVLQFLIFDRWIKGEAKDRGVTVSAKEQAAAFAKLKKDSFPTEADFQKALKQAGMTLEDAKFQVAANTIFAKLRDKAIKGADKVTDKQIADFYNKNKKRFAQPESRDARVVLTKTKSKAEAARKALKHGDSWTKVAKKYSIDTASKGNGGSLLGIAKGSQEPAFNAALFGAPKGKLTGPVKVQFGYYVFQVQKIVPAKQQTLKEATPAIKQELTAAAQKKADDKFNKDLRNKWKDKTNCRAGYVIDQCKNAPKPKTATTAPGAAVQQAPPPQAPPPQAPPPPPAPKKK
ncbi:MAG: foldase protein PrsA [bacterium]